METAISAACVSSAKRPVSEECTSAFGQSRREASAPGRKSGSCRPQTASSWGSSVREYAWKKRCSD